MFTISINSGISATLTVNGLITYVRALAASARELSERVELDERENWLRDPESLKCPEYSDIFKEVFGFRPCKEDLRVIYRMNV